MSTTKLVSKHESRTHDSAGEVASCQSVYVVVFVSQLCYRIVCFGCVSCSRSFDSIRFDFDTCYISIEPAHTQCVLHTYTVLTLIDAITFVYGLFVSLLLSFSITIARLVHVWLSASVALFVCTYVCVCVSPHLLTQIFFFVSFCSHSHTDFFIEKCAFVHAFKFYSESGSYCCYC